MHVNAFPEFRLFRGAAEAYYVDFYTFVRKKQVRLFTYSETLSFSVSSLLNSRTFFIN
ncbi:MAG: hypothetical protein MUP55_01965 [Candidatus Aenigmarchaeota archaeon]|nr:hypothetical protein [Candidatus Aenigmarchaeota archaeon]